MVFCCFSVISAVLFTAHVVLFRAHLALFYHPWYDNVVLLDACRTMGTIVGRTRKDGSKAFTAQIVIKKGGAIVHREARTFDRRPAANAWIVIREAELKQPDGLQACERRSPPIPCLCIFPPRRGHKEGSATS